MWCGYDLQIYRGRFGIFWSPVVLNGTSLSSPSSLFKPEDSQRRVNASSSTKIPEEVQLYLARKYAEDLRALRELFGDYAEEWVHEAERILDRSTA